MTNIEFVDKLKFLEKNYKTCYMLGSWGMKTTKSNIDQAVARTDVNNKPYKTSAYSIMDKGWMFDCVCMIKSVLWGFNGNESKPRGGGASYGSNGVPDIGADSMIKKCIGVTTDFSNIEIGEAVWVKGHIGVYIGDSKVIECTPRWNIAPHGVKITNLGNHGVYTGWSRTWTKHGKIPYITYVKEDELDMTKQEFDIVKREFIESITTEEALQIFNKARIEMQKPVVISNNDYRKPGLDFGKESGIMVGNETGNQMPNDVLTRGQAALMIMRTCEYIIKKLGGRLI